MEGEDNRLSSMASSSSSSSSSSSFLKLLKLPSRRATPQGLQLLLYYTTTEVVLGTCSEEGANLLMEMLTVPLGSAVALIGLTGGVRHLQVSACQLGKMKRPQFFVCPCGGPGITESSGKKCPVCKRGMRTKYRAPETAPETETRRTPTDSKPECESQSESESEYECELEKESRAARVLKIWSDASHATEEDELGSKKLENPSYVIFDNLQIKNLNVNRFGAVMKAYPEAETMTVELTLEKVLALIRVSLHSETVLTDVFLKGQGQQVEGD